MKSSRIMQNIEKLNSLVHQIETKLKNPQHNLAHNLREENLKQLQYLYTKLEISKKHPDYNTLFDYKAMNLAGIGLKNEDFGTIREGKYVQIISIIYVLNNQGKRTAKNISLAYFGKAEKIAPELKKNIIEFVLRWRYEKAFQHTEYYQNLLSKLS